MGEMEETIAKRISRIAQELELSVEELSSRSGLHKYRIRRVLGGKAPDDEEIEGFAKAFGLHAIELKSSLAARFGRFLREKEEYWCFQRMWPKVESHTGLRASTERPDVAHQMFDEVLDEYHSDQIWYGHGPFPFWHG